MLPIKTRGYYFILALLLFFVVPSSVSADWFQTASGDVYSNGVISIAYNQSTTPPNYFLSLSDIARGSSGVIYHNNASSAVGNGSQDDTETNLVEKWVQKRDTNSPNPPGLPTMTSEEQRTLFIDSLKSNFEITPVSVSDTNYFCPNLNASSTAYSYTGTQPVTIRCVSGTFGPNSGKAAVLFVNSAVTIRQPITLTGNDTFFMLVSNTSITFHNTISNVAGVYIAPVITTSNNPGVDTTQLVGEGVFYALSTFNLNRHVANDTNPAERFVFRPSLMLAAPRDLWDTFSNFQEIEP